MTMLAMHHPDDFRRLELMRLATRQSVRIPIHLSFDVVASDGRSMPLTSLLHAPLPPNITAASLLYPNRGFLSGSAFGSHSLLSSPSPLSLSVTRSLVHSTGRGMDYTERLRSPVRVTLPNENPMVRTTVPTLSQQTYHRPQGDSKLNKNFKPGPSTVIIGRKKNCYTSVGNLRLRDLVLMSLPAYSKCSKKKDKTEIVTGIVQMVRESCPDGGAFIKCDAHGAWQEVSEVIARERVASIFRDFLHDQYRSSSKSKVAKRREKRATDLMNEIEPPKDSSDEESCT